MLQQPQHTQTLCNIRITLIICLAMVKGSVIAWNGWHSIMTELSHLEVFSHSPFERSIILYSMLPTQTLRSGDPTVNFYKPGDSLVLYGYSFQCLHIFRTQKPSVTGRNYFWPAQNYNPSLLATQHLLRNSWLLLLVLALVSLSSQKKGICCEHS